MRALLAGYDEDDDSSGSSGSDEEETGQPAVAAAAAAGTDASAGERVASQTRKRRNPVTSPASAEQMKDRERALSKAV